MGCGRAPDGLPRAGSGRPLPSALCPPRLRASPKKAPAGPRPARAETSPRRVTRRSACATASRPPPGRRRAGRGTGPGAGVRAPSLPPGERRSHPPRNFPTIPRRLVTCAPLQGRRAGPSRLPPQAAPAAGGRGSGCGPALRPDVPAPSARLPGAGASCNLPGSRGPPPPPPQRERARRGEESSAAARPLESRGSSTRLLARPELAPRAGDTSGRLRGPRLPAGGRGQRPPHRLPEPSGRRPAPPSARPPLGGAAPAAAPAPAPGTGAKTPARGGAARGPAPHCPSRRGNGPGAGRPARQPRAPSSRSRSPSRPRAPVIFPFPPLTGPSRCQRFLPRRPARRAPCRPLCSWTLSPPRGSAPAAGLNLPTWNLEPARPLLRGFGGKPARCEMEGAQPGTPQHAFFRC